MGKIVYKSLETWFTEQKELLSDFTKEWEEKCKESEYQEDLNASDAAWGERFSKWQLSRYLEQRQSKRRNE